MPTVSIRSSELEKLTPGMVLRLDQPSNSHALLRVAGEPLIEARAVRQGSHRAAQVERLIPEVQP
jgi:flagellar motor switch protein FliM